jgi:hypothetical protein
MKPIAANSRAISLGVLLRPLGSAGATVLPPGLAPGRALVGLAPFALPLGFSNALARTTELLGCRHFIPDLRMLVSNASMLMYAAGGVEMPVGWQAHAMMWGALVSIWATPVVAANMSLAPLDNDPEHAIVIVVGDLAPGDDVAFRTHVGRLTKAIVAFNSDGGNLLAGIAIGKTVRMKSFATAVLDGQRCASACAIAWLGGSPRFMGRAAYVGFHAAYVERAGRASETGVGNALLGSYLTQIGLSERAVIYITQAAPSEMTWLTLSDAEQIGIEVLPFQQQAPATKPAQRVVSRETPNEELSEVTRRALLFVTTLNSKCGLGPHVRYQRRKR